MSTEQNHTPATETGIWRSYEGYSRSEVTLPAVLSICNGENGWASYVTNEGEPTDDLYDVQSIIRIYEAELSRLRTENEALRAKLEEATVQLKLTDGLALRAASIEWSRLIEEFQEFRANGNGSQQ